MLIKAKRANIFCQPRTFIARGVYLSIILYLMAYSDVSGQGTAQVLKGNFIFNYQAYNYEFSYLEGDNFGFTISKLDTFYMVGNGNNANLTADSLKVFFSEFNKETFTSVLKSQMIYRFHIADTRKLDDKASEVFYKVLTRFNLLDDEPVTANLILRRHEVNSYIKSNGSKHNGVLNRLIVKHAVHNVEVETEDGTIKNIKARLVKPGQNRTSLSFLEFKNQNPISISGKFDSETFADVNLYCLNCGGISELSRYLRLSDLLQLDIILENDKEDYSPANTRVILSASNSVEELKKEARSRIVEISAFSDFVGLDQEEPNGLVQIEAKRRMNLNPRYYLLFPQKRKGDLDLPSLMEFRADISYEALKVGKWIRYTIPQRRGTGTGDQVRSVPENGSRKTILRLEQTERNELQSGLSRDSTFVVRLDSVVHTVKDSVVTIYKDSTITTKTDTVVIKIREDSVVHIPATVVVSLAKQVSVRVPKKLSRQELHAIADTSLRNERDTVWIKARKFHSAYYNVFGSWEPKLLFAKLEENNRVIVPEQAPDGAISPITLFRYQLVSLGFTTSVLKFTFPQWKLSWTVLDVGSCWFRARVGADLNTAAPLNNSFLIAGSGFHFKPDSRWGVNIGGAFIRESMWSTLYHLSETDIWQIGIDGSLKTSPTARMFFRYRLMWRRGDKADNFTQIQLGYSLNLFALMGTKN
jgi:hypothetical protein